MTNLLPSVFSKVSPNAITFLTSYPRNQEVQLFSNRLANIFNFPPCNASPELSSVTQQPGSAHTAPVSNLNLLTVRANQVFSV